MYFESFSAALYMDGHGAYVWSAYAISLLVLAFMFVAPVVRQRKLLRQLAGQYRRQQGPAAIVEGNT